MPRLSKRERVARLRWARILSIPPGRRTKEEKAFLESYVEVYGDDLEGVNPEGGSTASFGGSDLPGMTP